MTEEIGAAERELLEQWSFLDMMVEKQAGNLRAGVQDNEDVTLLPSATATASLAVTDDTELVQLRQKVVDLESECNALSAQLSSRSREMAELRAGNARRVAALEARMRKHRDLLAAARQERRSLRATLSEMRLRLRELETEMSQMRRGQAGRG